MPITTDYDLDQAVADSAKYIVEDASNYDEALDWVTEAADNYGEVIYYSRAHALIAGCNTDAGRIFVEDCYGGDSVDYDTMACRIAYGEIESRLQLAVHNLWHETQIEGEVA
tara:strand:- start:199 stop:534 length:336 start_codon:yes stop_codon:yes gene_type:complete